MNLKFTQRLEPYLFILPTVALFLLVLAWPLLNLVIFSFGDSNIIQGYTGWNNFENYKFLGTPAFLKTVLVTLIWLFGGVIGIVACGMAVSLLLNKPIRGRAFFRALTIIPWIVPHAFAASMWSWVLHPQFGMLNQLLVGLGILDKPIGFLSENTALITVIVVRIWQGAPFMIISLLAALQTIPEDIEEAADLDGANGFQKFRFITIPYLKPVLTVSTLIIAAWTLQIFDTVYIMTNGGPARATQIIALEIYTKAFVESNLGIASAIALVTLITVGILSLYSLKKEGSEAS